MILRNRLYHTGISYNKCPDFHNLIDPLRGGGRKGWYNLHATYHINKTKCLLSLYIRGSNSVLSPTESNEQVPCVP